MNEEFNPYAPPQSVNLSAPAPDVELPLASRRRRIAASFLDSLILMVVLMPFQFFFGTYQREAARQASGGSMFAFTAENVLWSAATLTILVAINWTFLANGQTIFKRVLKLRIDRIEGGPCDRMRIITHRIVLLQILYLIPVINFIFMIVDCLMIFRGNKRTLHDEIAGTKVVYLGS